MEEEEASEKTKNYNYIGYSQAFPVDQQKYSLQADLLLKLAKEAVRKQDYYSAIKYLNTILMKNPRNETAKYIKKEVMEILEKIKKARTNKQGYTYI